MGNKTYKDRALPALVCFKEHFDRNDKSDHITRLDNVVQIIIVWPEWGDSNSRHLAPKCVSEPSAATFPPSLALSSAWAVPLENSFALLVSRNPFVFWDLCGIGFCILKDVPPGLRGAMTGQIPQSRGAETAPHKTKKYAPA